MVYFIGYIVVGLTFLILGISYPDTRSGLMELYRSSGHTRHLWAACCIVIGCIFTMMVWPIMLVQFLKYYFEDIQENE